MDGLPAVNGDPELLSRLVHEVLDNAFKFSVFADQPRVTVRSAVTRSLALLFVSDNGIGVDAEAAPQLFRLFKKSHRESRIGGNGIGLAISRRIAEAHGGDIRLERSGAAETVFRIALPLARG
jgi:signal transduction histidine kinase